MVPLRRSHGRQTTADIGGAAGTGRGGISEARRYTPRGRTVRDSPPRRDGTGGDAFRPALELVRDGTAGATVRSGTGRPAPDRTGVPARDRTPVPARDRTPAAGRGRAGGTARGTRTRGAPSPQARTTSRRPVRLPPAPPRLGDPSRRLRLGALLVAVLFAAIAGRLVTLQLTDARQLALAGLRSRLATEVVFAPRGSIYDRGRHVLAHSVEAAYVFADPSMIDGNQVGRVADALRQALGVPTSDLVPRLSRKTRADGTRDEFEYLARGVSLAVGAQVKALNLPGIGVGRDEVRDQPGHDLAANLIGFTSADGHGLLGLEASYEDLLAGQNGQRTFEVGNGDLGTQIPGGYEEEQPAHPGSSLELTIDRDVQYIVQQSLSDRMARANAAWACAVVLDLASGDVLAQASYPGYDAAEPAGSTRIQRTDSCSQTVADPGSVHKVITLGAGLQSGVITADSAVPVCPSITKGDQTFADTHPFACGTRITLPGILAFSSNVGTITVGNLVAPRTLYEYQRLFGLGAATGEGMPAEAPGQVRSPESWSGSSYGSIPIGMGVSATPLQMAAVYATIANNGQYVAPRLIRATVAADGTVHPSAPAARHQVLTAANAAILRHDLEAVVAVPHATGTTAAIPGYRVAGKTGTGLFVGTNGRYAPGEVASFIGMAPADAPRYVIAVFAYTPGGNGGPTCGPAFQEMMQFTLRHYQVPPTGTPVPAFRTTA